MSGAMLLAGLRSVDPLPTLNANWMSMRGGSKAGACYYGLSQKQAGVYYVQYFENKGGKQMGTGGVEVEAHNVPMQTEYSVGLINGYRLTGEGSDLMFTGQLSGCSFVMSPNQDRSEISVAHLKPEAGVENAGLQLDLNCMNGAKFAGVNASTIVFGARSYRSVTDAYACVYGVRRNGTWSIYAQMCDTSLKVVKALQIL